MAGVASGSKKEVSLYLMPMLDIFSILITFLLMSFSTDPVSHDLSRGTDIPESLTTISLDEVPTIVVTKSEIRVNDKQVTNLINGEVPESNLAQGAIFPLFQELKALSEVNKRLVESGESTQSKADALTMELDKDHRFKLIKRIMLSAQQAEFITFKLMVAKDL